MHGNTLQPEVLSSIRLISMDLPSPSLQPDVLHSTSNTAVFGDGKGRERPGKASTGTRCQFWLSNKRRYCANSRLPFSQLCGNHDTSSGDRRLPCPLDPSHSIFKENLESHIKRCPLRKQTLALEAQAYYSKGINSGFIDLTDGDISSKFKKMSIYDLNVPDFHALVRKIDSLHAAILGDLENSFQRPDACEKWLRRKADSKIPFQERHALQQASILGNMEKFGLLHRSKEEPTSPAHEECEGVALAVKKKEQPAVVEFGAGRGYLTHMLADSYGIKKIFLVERRSYKLKADRSLRQIESVFLERLRIDIEDLDLHAIESLNGHPYMAVGKHLCGNATDFTMKCCLRQKTDGSKKEFSSDCHLQGIALATCCHHLCQWKNYSNPKFFLDHGLTKQDFFAVTWFSSWAVDAHHSSDLSNQLTCSMNEINPCEGEGQNHFSPFMGGRTVAETVRIMKTVDRAALGFKCKDLLDMGRVLWLREHGLESTLVKYVPPTISPENHLLVAKLY